MVLIKIIFQAVYRLSARNRCILGKLTRSVKEDNEVGQARDDFNLQSYVSKPCHQKKLKISNLNTQITNNIKIPKSNNLNRQINYPGARSRLPFSHFGFR
jgi:transcription elongation factor